MIIVIYPNSKSLKLKFKFKFKSLLLWVNQKKNHEDSLSKDSFFDKKTLYTLSGTSFAVWLLSNVTCTFIPSESIWEKVVTIAYAALFSYATIRISKYSLKKTLLILVNACLIYTTAMGTQSIYTSDSFNSISKNDSIQMKSSFVLPFFTDEVWWKPRVLVDSINILTETVEIQKVYIYKQDSIISHFSDEQSTNIDYDDTELMNLKIKQLESENGRLNTLLSYFEIKGDPDAIMNEEKLKQEFIEQAYQKNMNTLKMLSTKCELLYKNLENFENDRIEKGNKTWHSKTHLEDMKVFIEKQIIEIDSMLTYNSGSNSQRE